MPSSTLSKRHSDAYRSLPPACKFVFTTLKRDGPLTFEQLRRKTTLPKATCSDAIHTLEDNGFVEPVSEFTALSEREYQLCQ